MNHNRFAILSDELSNTEKNSCIKQLSGSSSRQNPDTQERGNSELVISPIPGSVASEPSVEIAPAGNPQFFAAINRPQLKLVKKERPIIADLSNPNDLATQRTNQRVTLLMNNLLKLNQFLLSNPEPTLISLMKLEKHLISITEVLIRLRENFKARHYDKLVQEYEIDQVKVCWPKIIRNRIVHEFVTKDLSVCWSFYNNLASEIIKLVQYKPGKPFRPIRLDSYLGITKNYPQMETHKLEYTDDIASKLNMHFENIVQFNGECNITQIMSMTRASEIIRQLQAKDPEILNSGKIKIKDQVLDPEIVPYMMVIRNSVYHNISDFPEDHADAVLAYAQSLFDNNNSNMLDPNRTTASRSI